MTIANNLVTNTRSVLRDVSSTTLVVTRSQFDILCANNSDLSLELTQNNESIAMALTVGETGKRMVIYLPAFGIGTLAPNLGITFWV
ncbi:hypothetical protein [Chamaesiphon minutus]|uniref:Uncharacterized protein n=1 Tax=Chamaesiphon minutus (strain ATCC 27169 / PCC 6605) TaxID=1173020 RepID=K9UIJ2_CHAP6|nr:hypothetical protein [Chamaesiphon minutus]AFY94927.1 hypothetical protein Cha6605_3965 [Chamaesiphon minutus PCC 6605]